MKSTEFWDQKRLEIKNHIATHGVENFLDCQAIHDTMMVHYSTPWIFHELEALKQSFEWYRYDSAMTEDINPKYHWGFYRFCANTIHQMFHIHQTEKFLSKKIHEYNSILEFGGGFGRLCDLIKKLNYNDTYTIFDFPELNSIQNYYLGLDQKYNDNKTWCVSNLNLVPKSVDLLISCFALTESSPELINHFLYEVQWNNIMLVYSNKFCDLQNNNVIQELIKNKPDFVFKIWDIPWLPHNAYIFGFKKMGNALGNQIRMVY